MVIDGRAVADELYKELRERRAKLKRTPRLALVVVGADAVIGSFVRIKSRAAQELDIDVMRNDLPADTTTAQVVETAQRVAADADGLIVQLPLPKQIDTIAALSAIPDDKDVDALSSSTSEHIVEAPVALAVVELLRRAGVDLKGRRAVVVGSGRLVGAPTAALLRKLGADVSVFSLEEGSIDDLKTADIVVCGAGNPGFIKPEYLKEGVALIDAGASEQAGKVVGDCDPACEKIASVFTPVPGGVGPVAVAMIFKNLFDLMEVEK